MMPLWIRAMRPVLGVVRVGIHVIRFAVGGPAGVGDADGARGVLVGRKPFQFGHLTFGFIDVQLAVRADERHAGAVIAPVFER